MRKKILTITIISFLALGSFGFLLMALIAPASPSKDLQLPEGPHAIDLTPEMLGEEEVALRNYAAEVGPAIATQASPIGEPADVGDTFTFTLSDSYLSLDYDKEFEIIMEGEHCLLLLMTETIATFNGTHYFEDNPYGTWGYDNHSISTAQLTGLMNEFDNTIYPTVTDVFGEPLPRGDEGQKIWTLIFNIRGDSYYDDSVTSYIVGYFSASTSAENNKNIMHIDTYDWENRAGPGSSRVMEGVFAHEFQHLVHFDQDPDEPSWVDEGCADLAAYLCGYPHWGSHLAYYIVYHWATSLTFWGGGLEDYGASYMFALYLYEHYGGADFFRALVQDQANGIEGIENTLKKFWVFTPFERIFDYWTIANYLDDTSIAGGKYGYYTLDIGPDSWGWTIDDALTYYWGEPIFSGDWELTGWWGNPQPYTAHYYRFTTNGISKVYFNGDETSGVPAYSGTLEWYSGADAWTWRSFNQEVVIPETGDTFLNFMTYFEIEDDWDYAYVEVHDLTTDEWYTLDDPAAMIWVYNTTLHTYEYVPMRDFVVFSQDNPNCPAGLEPTDYETAGRWHAFTGLSDGWLPISMDLTPFAGDTIQIFFRLWQDGAFTLQNIYIDDIEITNGVLPLDDVEGGEDGWTTDGWYVTDGILDNNWKVALLKVTYGEWPLMEMDWVKYMWFNYGTSTAVYWVSRIYDPYFYVAIVSNQADHILTSSYTIGVEKKVFTWP
jgi:hypothetical protein